MLLSKGCSTQKEVDEIIQDIKSQKQPDPLNIFMDEYYYKHVPYMYRQLLKYKDINNCNYYLGLLFECYPESHKLSNYDELLVIKYLKDAAETGHPGAMYKLGHCYYSESPDYTIYSEKRNHGIELGVKALEKGYTLATWDKGIYYSNYNKVCFKQYTKKLRHPEQE